MAQQFLDDLLINEVALINWGVLFSFSKGVKLRDVYRGCLFCSCQKPFVHVGGYRFKSRPKTSPKKTAARNNAQRTRLKTIFLSTGIQVGRSHFQVGEGK